MKPLLKVAARHPGAQSMMFAVACGAAMLLGATPASAQSAAFSSGQATRAITSTPSVDASGALGLKAPTGTVPALSLDDVIHQALDSAPDARLATERVVQQEAALRRAWALLLPSLSVGAVYTHTCTGGDKGVDCGDRTTSFANQESLDQQALLFDTLADVMGVAAGAATDPTEADNFRARQIELENAAAQIRQTDVTPVVVQPASQLAGQLTLSMPLLNPRAYPALLNGYDGVSAARLAREQARQALVFSVVRAYYAAVTADRLVEASTRQVELATAQQAAVAARVAAATQPVLAEKRATLELLRARQTLAQTLSASENAIAVVGALIGRDEVFTLSQPPPPAPVAAADVEGMVAIALADRLEVKTQRTAVTIVERGVVDAWMQFMPSVGLTATARATSFTSGFVRDPVTGVLSISATLPLYDGGLRYAALDESNSRVTEERIRLKQLEDRVAAQVRGNVRDVRVRQEAHALASEALLVATEAQSQAQALFDAGVGTALDVNETNVALFGAETEALRAELDVALATIGLRWAVGESLY